MEQNEGYALTASGDRLVLGVDPAGRVVIETVKPHPEGQELAKEWLLAAAAAVRSARRHEGLPPCSLNELIAYIGFSR